MKNKTEITNPRLRNLIKHVLVNHSQINLPYFKDVLLEIVTESYSALYDNNEKIGLESMLDVIDSIKDCHDKIEQLGYTSNRFLALMNKNEIKHDKPFTIDDDTNG